jgi:hypothetical protein
MVTTRSDHTNVTLHTENVDVTTPRTPGKSRLHGSAPHTVAPRDTESHEKFAGACASAAMEV